MSKKSVNLPKAKLIKNFASSKPTSITSSIYSGNVNAQRAIQKPGSLYPLRPTQLKHISERLITEEPENINHIVEYHSWQPEYNKIVTREKIKKSMTKDPYLQKQRVIVHARETIATKEECYPELVPAKAVHVETPNIREPPKVSLPSIVRYLRSREPLPSEQLTSRVMTKRAAESLLNHETKSKLDIFDTKESGNVPKSTRNERLLNRPHIQADPSLIRRPPRRLVINVTHETIFPLSIYG